MKFQNATIGSLKCRYKYGTIKLKKKKNCMELRLLLTLIWLNLCYILVLDHSLTCTWGMPMLFFLFLLFLFFLLVID